MTGKTEAISIRRGLSLYKQPLCSGRGSPYWYARVYLPIGGRSIHTKSTGTTDTRQAQKFAEQFWVDCMLSQRTGQLSRIISRARDPNDGSFDHVAERWLEARKEEAGDDSRKLRAWKDDSHIYLAQNGLAAFFGRREVRSITTADIREYLRFQVRNSSRGKLASTTQKRTLVTLRSILKSAFERRLLDVLPLMPKIKVVDNPRPYFTRAEYRRLYVTAWAKARQARGKGDREGWLHWMEMADFVIIMVSTFLRPSEWQAIRHRDIRIQEHGETPHIAIAGVKGKTGVRDVLSMPAAIRAYRRLSQRTGADPDTYLFKPQFPNRQTATERMRDSFELLLKATGLKKDAAGKGRVIYSLRHSAIMFRIMDGNVPLLLLAKAAGTSVDQIERFYASHLQVGMMLPALHGVRE